MKSHRIIFEDEQMEFMKEYRDGFGVSVQEFVRVAVQEKINKITLEEDLKNLQRLKK